MTRIACALLLVGILALPFAVGRCSRRPSLPPDPSAQVLVVISPHNEAIRQEFAAGFSRWQRARTGRSVRIDWRIVGGTSEITRFLASGYQSAFEAHWRRSTGRPWSAAVEQGFQSDEIPRGVTPEEEALRRQARELFLSSRTGVGIDVFFGGGSFDFQVNARAGRLVDSGVARRHPDWLGEGALPLRWRGEPYRDPNHLWFGTTVSCYGILYNRDALARIGLREPPRQWADLGDPRYAGELALADPTKSGSINQAFEMVLQQQMQLRLEALVAAGLPRPEAEPRAVREGWLAGLRLVQRMGGNARYWTDGAQKAPIDIGAGNAAAGMSIDFYGRYQMERSNERGGRERLGFSIPEGGSSFSADPIGLLRGAPEPELAADFIEFVLSPEGQKLWALRAGTPGGPERHNLRRLPIRMDFYTELMEPLRADPGVNPYQPGSGLVYRREWTGGLFRELAFLVRVMALEPAPELKQAWADLVRAGFPEEARREFEDLSRISYDRTLREVAPVVSGRDKDAKLRQLRLSKELTAHFTAKYRRVSQLCAPGAP